MDNKCTIERFLGSIKDHNMTIQNNNGVNRCISFCKSINSFDMQFKLITWPGSLCIDGDMGTYVFSSVQDMFSFFRSSDMKINPGYWHEKLRADSRFEPSMKYSEGIFESIIKDEFRTACLDKSIPIKDRKDVWGDIYSFVLNAESEEDAHAKANEFKSHGFSFSDFWEHELKEYSYHFIWCLYAIVWGINRFDTEMDTKCQQTNIS